MSKYSEMAYGELQLEAKKLGVAANGTKKDILKRIEGASADTQTKSEEVAQNEPAQEEPAKEPVATGDKAIEKEWRGDAAKMKEHLDAQPKVSVMIPLEQGVAPEQAEKVPFTVNLNGYRFSIKRGTFVEVPKQVADMIKERLESEGSIGRDKRIDRDQEHLDALG